MLCKKNSDFLALWIRLYTHYTVDANIQIVLGFFFLKKRALFLEMCHANVNETEIYRSDSTMN